MRITLVLGGLPDGLSLSYYSKSSHQKTKISLLPTVASGGGLTLWLYKYMECMDWMLKYPFPE